MVSLILIKTTEEVSSRDYKQGQNAIKVGRETINVPIPCPRRGIVPCLPKYLIGSYSSIEQLATCQTFGTGYAARIMISTLKYDDGEENLRIVQVHRDSISCGICGGEKVEGGTWGCCRGALMARFRIFWICGCRGGRPRRTFSGSHDEKLRKSSPIDWGGTTLMTA